MRCVPPSFHAFLVIWSDLPMRMFLPIGLLCGLSLLIAEQQAVAQEQPISNTIAVDLLSGRTFNGEVDPQTDASELWLRSQRGGTTILRPIRWERVVRASSGRDTVSGEQLREIVDTVRRAMRGVAQPRPLAVTNR
jgi:hypothetical protein